MFVLSLILLSHELVLVAGIGGGGGDGDGQIPDKPLTDEATTAFWLRKGREELRVAEALAYRNGQRQFKRPKNVVIFVGDGMGLTTQAAARLFKGQQQNDREQSEELVWEQFPALGLLKTYNLDRFVPDSASAGTALFSGVKAKAETLGLSTKEDGSTEELSSIIEWAQQQDMYTGFVTNMRLTHSTPASLYAQAPDRKWECDHFMPEDAKQHYKGKLPERLCPMLNSYFTLVEEDPGRSVRVILGGGRPSLKTLEQEVLHDPWTCGRRDGADLLGAWRQRHPGGVIVTDRNELEDLDPDAVDFLFGVFSESHLEYTLDRNESSTSEPTLTQMTTKAIQVLSKGPSGFLLVVESGNIDLAHHFGWANKALAEVLELEKAVQAAIALLDVKETLLAVTSDHGHTLSITGKPERVMDIRGKSNVKDSRGQLTSILTYATGPGRLAESTKVTDPDFQSPALYSFLFGLHDGSDVGVFAIGPMSYLFHSVHEQTHVAHVIAYALCMGPYKKSCRRHYPEVLSLSPGWLTPSSTCDRPEATPWIMAALCWITTAVTMWRGR